MQVLSQSVANALDFYGSCETVETKKFVEMFNKYFDILNVRSKERMNISGRKIPI